MDFAIYKKSAFYQLIYFIYYANISNHSLILILYSLEKLFKPEIQKSIHSILVNYMNKAHQ